MVFSERLDGDTAPNKGVPMKKDIHPNYQEINVSCSCGNKFVTRSTLNKDLHLDVCSACHPFYTGQQKIVDTGGRVDKFNKRFSVLGKKG